MNKKDCFKILSEKILQEDPELTSMLFKVIENLARKKYPIGFVNAVFQSHKQKRPNMYDAFAFFWIWRLLHTGKLLYTIINVESIPFKNCLVKENNEILSKLTHPFKAEFIPEIGRGADKDGWFSWNSDIYMNKAQLENDDIELVRVGTYRIPLEVGTTKASTTILHLIGSDRGLARWAYASSEIYVFLLKDNGPGKNVVKIG